MTTLTTRTGDTYDSLSRRAYGRETEAARIASANPGVSEPIPAGTVVIVPDIVMRPALPSGGAAEDELRILFAGRRFRFWDSIVLHRAIDSPPSITVGAVWEPGNAELREAFRPFSYPAADFYVGSERLFTGSMLTPSPTSDANGSRIVAAGYGRTGVLSDCTAPASAYPLEFNNQSLRTIAARLLRPFGIEVRFDGPAGLAFERVALEPGRKILPFLIQLAQQRNLVIGESADGAAVFRLTSDTSAPVADLLEGAPPVTNIAAAFNGQNVYSHLTGISPTVIGLDGVQSTVRNEHLQGVLRPFVFSADDTTPGSLRDTVRAKRSRMLANMASWSVALPTWRSASGALWQPGDVVTATAPRAMIYRKSRLLIRSVRYEATPQGRIAELNLVLPGAFSGDAPEVLPWEE